MTVVTTLLEQIRRQPVPKHDRLENLIDFSLSVEEICATVRTSGVKTSYDGPILQELVICRKDHYLNFCGFFKIKSQNLGV